MKRFSRLFSDNGEFRFVNAPPVYGSKARKKRMATFHGPLSVKYTREDGQKVAVPFADPFKTGRDGRVTQWRIFMDLAPVFAPSLKSE